MFRRLFSVLFLNRIIANYCVCFLNYLGVFIRKPFFRYVDYLNGEYRRNQRDVNFFLKNTTFYGSIRL
jgi:hypothetical protein